MSAPAWVGRHPHQGHEVLSGGAQRRPNNLNLPACKLLGLFDDNVVIGSILVVEDITVLIQISELHHASTWEAPFVLLLVVLGTCTREEFETARDKAALLVHVCQAALHDKALASWISHPAASGEDESGDR